MQLIILCGLTNEKQQGFIKKSLASNKSFSLLSNVLTPVTSKEKTNSAHTKTSIIELYKRNQDKLKEQFNESILFHFEDNPEQLSELNLVGLNHSVLYFYNAPERFVASNLEAHNEIVPLVKQWNDIAKNTLADFIKKIDNAMLFNTQQVLLNIGSFVSTLEKQLNCELKSPESICLDEVEANSNIFSIEEAFSVLETSHQTQTLFEQLESAAELLNKSCDSSIEYRKAQWVIEVILLAKSLVQQNEQLAKNQSCTKQSEEVEFLKQSNTALASARELSLLQVNQLQEELETTHLRLGQAKVELNELNSVKENIDRALLDESSKTHNLAEENKALTSENELSLLQINQLQEELETTHLRLGQAEVELNELNSVKGNIDRALLDESSKTHNLAEENKALTSENELSLLQIHQLQEELEHAALNLHESKEDSIDQFEARMNKLQQDCSELLDANTDLSVENELSLLQIHQLQEELEHYYIKLQQGGTYSPFLLTEHENNVGLANCMQLLKAIS